MLRRKKTLINKMICKGCFFLQVNVLYLNKDNTLTDCMEVETTDLKENDVVQDYKKLTKKKQVRTPYLLGYRTAFFLPKNPKNLDPSNQISVANLPDFLIPFMEFCVYTSANELCIFPSIFLITEGTDMGLGAEYWA